MMNDDTHSAAGSDADSTPSTLYARNTANASRAINAKRLRMAAERDVSFLQNRLSKLKNEELKAKQEIGKLKSKTDEISSTKQRHEQTGSQRKELQDQVDYSKRKEAALIALQKERQSKAVWASKQRTMQTRREAVVHMRKQKEINECRAHILKEEQRDRNTKQRESIRQLHEKARERRAKQQEEKKEALKEYYEQRIQREEEERIQKEKIAAQLVAQEAQMIYRLKRLHSEKQNALRSLADTIDGATDSAGNSAARSRGSATPNHDDSGLPPLRA